MVYISTQSIQSSTGSGLSLHEAFRPCVNVNSHTECKSREKYQTELAALSSLLHGRNNNLVRIALYGLNAGVTPEQIEADMIAHGGEPTLSTAEVHRAVETAQFRRENGGSYRTKPRTIPSPITPQEREFVPRMLAAGRGFTTESIRNASPVRISHEPQIQCMQFIETIVSGQDGYFFSGSKYDRRTRESLLTGTQLLNRVRTGYVPEFFIPNAFTGEPGQSLAKDGTPRISYGVDAVIRNRLYAVIEFDDMPLEHQVEFFAGVLKTGTLGLRSLTYSGGKSIHALIELCHQMTPDGQDDRDVWVRQWDTLERLLCSAEDPTLHADKACKNASRLTRMAGAVRSDNNKTQALLWLNSPKGKDK